MLSSSVQLLWCDIRGSQAEVGQPMRKAEDEHEGNIDVQHPVAAHDTTVQLDELRAS